jgi:hypothetical protein
MGEVANTLFAAYPTLEPDELVFVGNPDPTIYKIGTVVKRIKLYNELIANVI